MTAIVGALVSIIGYVGAEGTSDPTIIVNTRQLSLSTIVLLVSNARSRSFTPLDKFRRKTAHAHTCVSSLLDAFASAAKTLRFDS